MQYTYYLTLSILFIFSIESLAQPFDDYLPGYIITKEGKTHTGFIKNEPDKIIIDRVMFKASEGDEYTAYTPGQLKEFGLEENVRFISYLFHDEIVFFKCHVEGCVSLYSYWPEKKEVYYVTKEDVLIPIQKDTIFQQDPRTGEQKPFLYNKYNGGLNSFFRDCPELQQKQYKTDLKRLRSYVSKYHECTTSQMETYKTKRNKLRYWGLSAGFVISDYFPKYLMAHYETRSPHLSNKISMGPSIGFISSGKNGWGIPVSYDFRMRLGEKKLQPYFSFGLGMLIIGGYSDYYEKTVISPLPTLNAGVGLEYNISATGAIRLDINSRDILIGFVSLGYNYRFR